jgi:hypothetical protein
MGKHKLPSRFSKMLITNETKTKFERLMGPLINFVGGTNVHYLNLRMQYIKDPHTNKFKYKYNFVNSHHRTYTFGLNEYLKNLLRIYSDSVIISEKMLKFEEFEFDKDIIDMNDEMYKALSKRKDGKKPLGIISTDLSLNFLKNDKIFLNNLIQPVLITKEEKLNKLKTNEKYSSEIINLNRK